MASEPLKIPIKRSLIIMPIPLGDIVNAKTIRHFGLTLIAGLILTACGGSKDAAKPADAKPADGAAPTAKLSGQLNMYNWAEYIPEGMSADFEKTTGVKLNYDTFDTDETLNAKIIAGNTGYDIVVPGAAWGEQQVKQGKYLKLDKSKIPNLKNLDPALMAQIAKMDPNNEHLVPWAWGFTGIGINEEKVTQALGGMPLPENPFDLVFKPEYANKLKSCGIFMLDSPSEILPVALQYMGKDASSSNVADYTEALEKVLKPIRGTVRKFGDSAVVNDIANGNLCVALAWSGDVNMAAKRASNPKIRMLVGHGGIVFFDTMAIPADAKNIDNAYAFINYYLDPKVNATMTNDLNYAIANKAALEFVKPEIASNKTIFLDPAVLEKMAPRRLPASEDARKAMTEAFREFKAAK